MSAHGATALPGSDKAASHELRALHACLRVAVLIAELARLRLREHETREELMEFVSGREGSIAAAQLAQLLEQLSQGGR